MNVFFYAFPRVKLNHLGYPLVYVCKGSRFLDSPQTYSAENFIFPFLFDVCQGFVCAHIKITGECAEKQRKNRPQRWKRYDRLSMKGNEY